MQKETNSFLALAVIIIVAIVAATLVIIKVIDANQAQNRANDAVQRL